MAIPSDLKIESHASTKTRLKWTSVANTLTLRRSTDDVTYADVGAAMASGTSTREDTGLTSKTRYWYKLTDGTLTTSAVNVTTQACQSDLDTTTERDLLGLPRFDGSDGDLQALNAMAQQLEAVVNEKALKGGRCDICPTNGAVILNCQECSDFQIMATTDITSITMLNCDKGEGTVDVLIPPNTTRFICGWPETFGMEGHECWPNGVSGGTEPAGRVFSFPYRGTNRGPQAGGMPGAGVPTTGGGGGSGGGGCACTESPAGTLTIVCCTASCSMDCATAEASRAPLQIRACGGVPPYTWSSTGSELTTEESGADAEAFKVTSPTNTGSGVLGNAYQTYGHSAAAASCATPANYKTLTSGCNQQQLGCETAGTISSCGAGPLLCTDGSPICAGTVNNCTCGNAPCQTCAEHNAGGSMCDLRTQVMIDAGCKPCNVVSAGKVITVTDSVGTSASKTLAA